jgi:hypothetical protein
MSSGEVAEMTEVAEGDVEYSSLLVLLARQRESAKYFQYQF